jgi:hypothetical protein
MKNYEGKLAGVMGAVIIHLIAGIIFMSFQIKSLHRNRPENFMVEFARENETETKEKLIELPASTVEKILQDDPEMLNIARNLSNRSEQQINPDEYIDKVKEELINSGKLGSDNYIDEQKRMAENNNEDRISVQSDSAGRKVEEKSEESQKMASNYKGPTRIYYDLPGRTHSYLPIPIYMCQGSGNVVLSIDVNQRGEVTKAQIIARESTTTDQCLVETAIQTALISRFNSDMNSPKIQTGRLSYLFVAQ